jgi:ribosomal protein S19
MERRIKTSYMNRFRVRVPAGLDGIQFAREVIRGQRHKTLKVSLELIGHYLGTGVVGTSVYYPVTNGSDSHPGITALDPIKQVLKRFSVVR